MFANGSRDTRKIKIILFLENWQKIYICVSYFMAIIVSVFVAALIVVFVITMVIVVALSIFL